MAAGSAGRALDELLSFLRSDSIDHLNTFFSQLVSVMLSDTAAPSPHRLSFVNGGDQVWSEVNSWVERETNGLITDLFPSKAVANLTSLVYANTLCFKGVWKHEFDASCTSDCNFHLLNGTSVKVPFMGSEKNMQYIRAFDGFKVLRLSYKEGRDQNRRFSMCIFLPDAKDGLSALIEKLASEPGFLKGKLPQRKVPVGDFSIPKFKISFALEASNVLKELGVVSPFSQRHADFSKMVKSPLGGVYVENMFHKASIEVDEQGTEATAAHAMLGRTIGLTTGIDFVADHPFLFLIREYLTGTILFIGQVLNPLDGADPWVEEGLRARFIAREKCIASLLRLAGVTKEGDDGDDKLDLQPKRKRSRKDQ